MKADKKKKGLTAKSIAGNGGTTHKLQGGWGQEE